MNMIRAKLQSLLQKIKGFLFRRKIHYINGSQALPEPLSKEEEEALLARLQSGESAVREELIVHNLRLVVYIAKKFETSGVFVEDLISIGTIGLIKAVNTFRPEKNIKLATYASRCIENEILMHFRNQKKSAQDISMSEPIDTDPQGNPLTLSEIIFTDDTIADDLDTKIKIERLRKLIDEMPETRAKQILIARYGLDGNFPKTQREIAEQLHISRSYVSRIEKKTLEDLRDRFDP